jgi:signal transduction histidine kinase
VQISQVLLNLLMNAFDAVVEASGKRVLIRLTQDPASIHFAVQDSGKGIPESLRQKIFQPFFTTKEIGKGTGLGLSISQGIMKNHGGQLMLTEDSPGATFLMLLPKRTPARFRS